MSDPRHWLAATLCALAVVGAPAPASAQADSFPSKPIKLIVPFPPGGGADLTARTLAQSPDTIAALQEPLHSDVVEALAQSIAHIYWFTVPLAALAVVNALRVAISPKALSDYRSPAEEPGEARNPVR